MDWLDRIFANLGEGYAISDGPDKTRVAPGHLASFVLAARDRPCLCRDFLSCPGICLLRHFTCCCCSLRCRGCCPAISFFLLKYRVPVYLLVAGWLLFGPNLWGGMKY